jgi:hypothetical protein
VPSILGTPLSTTRLMSGGRPVCGVCVGVERNNQNAVFQGSYYRSTGVAHNVTFGYDLYTTSRRATTINRLPTITSTTSHLVRDSVIYPVIEPGFSTFVVYWPLTESTRHELPHALVVLQRRMGGQPAPLVHPGPAAKNHGRDHGRNRSPTTAS